MTENVVFFRLFGHTSSCIN